MIKFKRWRSEKHLARIRQQPCISCGNPPPNHAHHICGVGDGVMGSKASDSMSFSLCYTCHHLLHIEGRGVDRQWEWLARTLVMITEGKG